jgi:hypothetical protein
MSAPTRNEQDLSRREEMSVSSAAMSGAPWGAAAATGAVVAVGDLGLHIIATSLGVGALSGSLAAGAVAFFVVAAAGALWRAKPGRAIRWARSNPWRFAVMPALACAAIALVLSVVTGGGLFPAVLSGLWHGGIVYGLTGAAGAVSKSRKSASLGRQAGQRGVIAGRVLGRSQDRVDRGPFRVELAQVLGQLGIGGRPGACAGRGHDADHVHLGLHGVGKGPRHEVVRAFLQAEAGQ